MPKGKKNENPQNNNDEFIIEGEPIVENGQNKEQDDDFVIEVNEQAPQNDAVDKEKQDFDRQVDEIQLDENELKKIEQLGKNKKQEAEQQKKEIANGEQKKKIRNDLNPELNEPEKDAELQEKKRKLARTNAEQEELNAEQEAQKKKKQQKYQEYVQNQEEPKKKPKETKRESESKPDIKKRNQELFSALNENLEDLTAKHRITNRGGSSDEHEKMCKSVAKLMACTKAPNSTPLAKAEALLNARKDTMAYINAKRGNNANPDWMPRTQMGKRRFSAANSQLEVIDQEIEELGLDGTFAKVYALEEGLKAKHWHGYGGSSPEHTKMITAFQKLKKACLKESPQYSEERKIKALQDAKKAAQNYIQKKQGANPEGWRPKTGMGKERFESALALIDTIDEELAALGVTDDKKLENKQPQKKQPGKDPVKSSQEEINTLLSKGDQFLKDHFQDAKNEAAMHFANIIATRMVYDPIRKDDPNHDFANDQALQKKRAGVFASLLKGVSPHFNEMVGRIQTPEDLKKVGQMAAAGNGNLLLYHTANTKLPENAHRTENNPQMDMELNK